MIRHIALKRWMVTSPGMLPHTYLARDMPHLLDSDGRIVAVPPITLGVSNKARRQTAWTVEGELAYLRAVIISSSPWHDPEES